MKHCDLDVWVNASPDPGTRALRQAFHTVLHAISISPHLHQQMSIKGGILLAIRYDSSRYTRDIDFSTPEQYSEFDRAAFVSEFTENLARAVEELDYGLDCRMQSIGVNPAKPGATFPTLTVTIGYAIKSSREHQRLIAGQCPTVIALDYSFNEVTAETEELQISGGGIIQAYSLHDLVAEKYRAILQQEVRNRIRRQDAYDLYGLFRKFPIADVRDKQRVLDSLRAKAASRGLMIDRNSITNPAIISRSEKEYDSLAMEIDEQLPPFDDVFAAVREVYQSLPW